MNIQVPYKNQISGFLIVKDGIKTIKECLNALAQIASEIVVVDTGSTDGTLEFLRSYPQENFKIFTYKWHDDFATARNFALKHCSCAWVFFVDADEILTPEGIACIKDLQEHDFYDKVAYWIENTEEFYYAPRLELFRTDLGLQFKGRVHEYLDGSELPQDKIGIVSTGIKHLKTVEEVHERAIKYFNIAEQALKANELNTVRDFYFYGMSAQMAGKHDLAWAAFDIAIRMHKLRPAWLISDVVNCYDSIAMYYQNNGKLQQAIETWLTSVELFPRYDIFYFVAECCVQLYKYRNASYYLSRAKELMEIQKNPCEKFFVSKLLETKFIPELEEKIKKEIV